ncbi:amino acid adenylation domain-containing protein [Cryptosporangium sp. NPDC051539]|uniref:amino acid adenylation domain-containing protein n=1 Tax=Cryptosporangium sp. NPDC051539 TaxID=3363962 RepID=UPI0037A43DDA
MWTFPASYAQERVWLADRARPGSGAFAVGLPVPLPPGVDADGALAALAAVVARHESLRTSFRLAGGVLEQVVHAEVDVAAPVMDLRTGSGSPAERVHAVCAADAAEPFDLARAPLWRARLLRFADDEWVLGFVAHHTICDGRSWYQLAAELTELCVARREERAPNLPALPIQYADWAVWQREKHLTPDRVDRQLAYWRRRLADLPPVPALPTDRPRTLNQDDAGGDILFTLPTEVAERVATLARRWRVTEFAVLFAGYVALLARLGGDPDVVVGVPLAGRDEPQVAALIGMFVNTVLLRIDTADDPTFETLARRIAEATLQAIEHGDVPFQQVVSILDQPGAPLPQFGFNFLRDTPRQRGYGTARDELVLEISGSEGRLEYRKALFDEATAQALVDRYLRILDAAGRVPATRVSELPLLSDVESATVVDWGTGAEAAGAELVLDRVLAQAQRSPDAVAVRAGSTVLTYRELVERAERLADRLAALGAAPGRVVAVAVPRSAEYVIAVLGVVLAGAAYLPIDPDQPADRVELLLGDAGADLVVVADRAVATGRTVVGIDADEPAPRAERPRAAAGDLAYVLHTSGSSGPPKGVAIEHGSLAGYVRWFARRCELGPGDRVLAATAPTFDAAVNELFPVLATGGTIVVAPGPVDPRGLIDLAVEHAVTLLPTVPTVLAELIATGGLERCTSVRQVVCGGEQLTGDLRRALAEQLPVPLHNIYGPTETTVGVTAHTCPPDHEHAGAVPIGRPIPGARLRVLDRSGRPVPIGSPGELLIGGDSVARGYVAAPARTAERFGPDPDGRPGARRYRTGDLVRWRPDGELEFLGRLDAQLKVRGIRIEPGEIEAALRAAGAAQALVRMRDGALVAYVVGGPPDPDALARALPRHLLPTAILSLDALPRTTSGKIDVAALPAPVAAGGRPPATPAEELIAEVWAEVLGADQISADDDFFALGGHSLLAARIVARLSDLLELEVPIELVFTHETVAELARAVEAMLTDAIAGLSVAEAEHLLAEQGGQP